MTHGHSSASLMESPESYVSLRFLGLLFFTAIVAAASVAPSSLEELAAEVLVVLAEDYASAVFAAA